jgi:hypothetical protein
MEAISKRRSAREFARTELPLPMLSDLLLAINAKAQKQMSAGSPQASARPA